MSPAAVPKKIAEELTSLKDTNSLLSKETTALKSLLDESSREMQELKGKVTDLEAEASKNTPRSGHQERVNLQNKVCNGHVTNGNSTINI